MTKLQDLIDNIKTRQDNIVGLNGKPDTRKKYWMLYDKDPEEILTHTYGQVLVNIERQAKLVQLVSSLGQSLNRKYKFKLDEVGEMHVGWFVVVAYFDLGILGTKATRVKEKGRWSKHSVHHPIVKDTEALQSLIDLVDEERVELFPTVQKPALWEPNKFIHATGYPLIKHAHEDARAAVKVNDMSYLLDSLNKLSSTGWRINGFVFDVFKKAKFHKGEKTPFKAMKEVDPIKRASLEVEMRAIERLAERNIDNAFYHLYNCDFRGRIYPNTAFLHEQSSDNAKGLLLLDEAVPLGKRGYYWLKVHTANVWGNDKVTLNERALWVEDNLNELLSYVNDPLANDGWMDADKPFCFLACCVELSMLYDWVYSGNRIEDFPSCLPIYVDGSNNGVQHLTAMSCDEEVAPLVNLVPLELPGDVYMFIADKTIENVHKDVEELPDAIVDKFEEVYDELIKLKAEVAKYQTGTEVYKQAISALRAYGNSVYDMKKQMGPVFWSYIKNRKIWRKTVKRPVMVLGYGGTSYGMRDMVHEDTYDLSDYLRDKDKAWSIYLGSLIYNTCMDELKGPAEMLNMFEALAVQENEKEAPVAYTQLITNFPFVHYYKESKTTRVKLKYGDDTFDLSVKIKKEDSPLKQTKQKSSTAPNIVHSVDAVHLTMTVHDADYPVTVVHDSFGCHAGNMEHMFTHVREKFVELYQQEPLEHIFAQMDALHLIPEKGKLDVKQVLESDFAFA
jgi:DNA-directed RNA polymerase